MSVGYCEAHQEDFCLTCDGFAQCDECTNIICGNCWDIIEEKDSKCCGKKMVKRK